MKGTMNPVNRIHQWSAPILLVLIGLAVTVGCTHQPTTPPKTTEMTLNIMTTPAVWPLPTSVQPRSISNFGPNEKIMPKARL